VAVAVAVSVAPAAAEEAEARMIVSFGRRERERVFPSEKLRLAGSEGFSFLYFLPLFSLSFSMPLFDFEIVLVLACERSPKEFLIVGKWILESVAFTEVGLTFFELGNGHVILT